MVGDLTDPRVVARVLDQPFAEVYQLAADMGGAGYIFTGEHDADVMHNSAGINLNVARQAVQSQVQKIFYSSSACIYPERNQMDPDNPDCSEESAYPAAPDSEYGAVRCGRVRGFLRAVGIVGIHLVALGVDAGRGRVEDLAHLAARRACRATFRLIDAELCMTSASCSPVKMYPAPPISAASWKALFERPVEHRGDQRRVREVSDHEVIGLRLPEQRQVQVDTAYPMPVAFELFDEVRADETAGSAHQCCLRHDPGL